MCFFVLQCPEIPNKVLRDAVRMSSAYAHTSLVLYEVVKRKKIKRKKDNALSYAYVQNGKVLFLFCTNFLNE